MVIQLGAASGTVKGIEVGTAVFTGNYAPFISVEGCFSDNDDEVVSWQGNCRGWETKWPRSKDHTNCAIVKLGAPGQIDKFVVDTAHFRGNFPEMSGSRHCIRRAPTLRRRREWKEAVAPTKTKADQEKAFASTDTDSLFTHMKLVMIPGGGVKRVRALAAESSKRLHPLATVRVCVSVPVSLCGMQLHVRWNIRSFG